MNLPCLFVPNELSDEAAACVAELLLNLAHAFDSQYATQICRHYDEFRQSPTSNARTMAVSSTLDCLDCKPGAVEDGVPPKPRRFHGLVRI